MGDPRTPSHIRQLSMCAEHCLWGTRFAGQLGELGVRSGDEALHALSRRVVMATISGPPPPQRAQFDRAPPRATPKLNGALPRAPTLDNGNGWVAPDPAVVAGSGSDERQSKGGIEGLIGRRVAAATEHALEGP